MAFIVGYLVLFFMEFFEEFDKFVINESENNERIF